MKIKGLSRDGSAKLILYTNKICRDNLSHPLYIPMFAFIDAPNFGTSDSVCSIFSTIYMHVGEILDS